ncbi:WbqC family protein [Pelosinus propionicus]|uniref:WbqC-like protein family protein n=1 Tax=Pelosinus propionicus DSM 13327 TaxID=1123291 RepID=A0A1I4HUY9_9FIRM|nr:WbqC family protein [Pelosinus propionicus]SFL45236.1 WbqC-like protein family protein [Pelosinus propionicus DSM 13327]
MKIAIMQPYFFPYIGYFQLINAVDVFIIYDNIQYTKKGWISRNRFLQNGKDSLFSISLKKDSDFLDVRDRVIATEFNKQKLFNQIVQAYKKAPYFMQFIPLFEKILFNDETNLFKFIYFSIREICNILEINTEIIISSNVAIDHSLKSQEKVIAICKENGAGVYVNPIGGLELYSKESFREHGIDLRFIKSKLIEYEQFNNVFFPWLSIIDVMMFNSKEEIKGYLDCYDLI